MMERREFLGLFKAFACAGLAAGLPLPLGVPEWLDEYVRVDEGGRFSDHRNFWVTKRIQWPDGTPQIFMRKAFVSSVSQVVMPPAQLNREINCQISLRLHELERDLLFEASRRQGREMPPDWEQQAAEMWRRDLKLLEFRAV